LTRKNHVEYKRRNEPLFVLVALSNFDPLNDAIIWLYYCFAIQGSRPPNGSDRLIFVFLCNIADLFIPR
jgi:hypothetical protein